MGKIGDNVSNWPNHAIPSPTAKVLHGLVILYISNGEEFLITFVTSHQIGDQIL